MPGRLRLRLRYRRMRSPWFDYLMVSPDEMRDLASDTPWHVRELMGEPDTGLYIALLGKN